MEIKDLRKLSGLSECGPMAAPMSPPTPASVSMTAASGSELSGMLKDIMSLAGLQKVEPHHLGAEPAPMKLLPEPVKAVGPVAGDSEIMRGIADKLNLDKDDEEMKADEAWDNTPADAEPKEPFDAEEFAHHENPPGAAKGRNFKNNPVANVEDIAERLFTEYQNFLAESEFELNNEEANANKVEINGKPVNVKSIEVDGVDTRDYPDFADAYITYAEFEDGTPLTDEELELFADLHSDVVYQIAYDSVFETNVEEEKSWFDMTSAERAAHVASGKSKAHRSGGQPGHSAAPAKTGKSDIMRTAKDVKAHSEKEPSGDREDN